MSSKFLSKLYLWGYQRWRAINSKSDQKLRWPVFGPFLGKSPRPSAIAHCVDLVQRLNRHTYLPIYLKINKKKHCQHSSKESAKYLESVINLVIMEFFSDIQSDTKFSSVMKRFERKIKITLN